MIAPLAAHGSTVPAARDGSAANISVKAFYPEGVEIVGDTILWAEMPRDRVRSYSNGATSTVWSAPPGCGPTAVRRTPQGHYWVLCHLGHKVLLLSSSWRAMREIMNDDAGNRLKWPNDGKVDSTGRLYFSSAGVFEKAAPAEGYVVAVAETGPATRIAGPFKYANGIALSRDGEHLYVSEHLGRRVWQLRLDRARPVSKQVFFDLNEAGLGLLQHERAGPDGLYLTAASELIVAEYGAGRLLWIASDGRLKRIVPVPFKYVTNLNALDGDRLVVVGTFSLDDRNSRGRVIAIDARKVVTYPAP